MLEKKRNDLFRHWLLGLGSGDLHVKTGGPANLDFELNNVLFVGWKLARIQDLLREKEVDRAVAPENRPRSMVLAEHGSPRHGGSDGR